MKRAALFLSLALGAALVMACGDDSGADTDGGTNQNNENGSRCGNGTIEGAEECDNGAANSDSTPDACRTDCSDAHCGDGVTDTGEACDDGAQNSDIVPDACRADCSLPTCGDDVVDVQSGETCDLGPDNSDAPNALCRTDCKTRRCGDGIIDMDAGEICDGTNVPISADCRGFGYYDGTPSCNELCGLSPMGCTGTCGDGVINGDPDDEVCDTDPPSAEFCVDYGFDGGHLSCSDYCSPGFDSCLKIGWRTMHVPLPADYQVRGLWGASPLSIHGVGNNPNGSFAVHYQGGAWILEILSIPLTYMEDIWGASDTDVYAVGVQDFPANGVVIHYDGTGWSPLTVPTVDGLRGIWGSGPDDIWAVGDAGAMLHKTASGWTAVSHGLGTPDLKDVWGFSASDVWAVGLNGTLWHNTGSGWGTVSHLMGNVGLYALWGTSTGELLVATYGSSAVMWRYDGSSFTSEALPDAVGIIHRIWGTSSNDIWAVGENDVVLHYNGTRWRLVAHELADPVYALWGFGPQDVFIGGGHASIQRYESDTYWGVGSSDTGVLASGIHGTRFDDVWVAGSPDLLRHFDGLGWSDVNPGYGSQNYSGVWAAAANDVWVVAGVTVLRKQGNTWSSTTPPSGGAAFCVWGSGPSDVYFGGGDASNGRIYHYDGSLPLTQETVPVDWGAMGALWGSSATDVYAVRYSQVLHSTGTGTWTETLALSDMWLYGVWGSSASDVWVVGANGTLMHYDGTAWSPVQAYTGVNLQAVWGTGPNDVWFSGAEGTLLHWDGSRIEPVDTDTDRLLAGLWGVPGEALFILSNSAYGGWSYESPILFEPQLF